MTESICLEQGPQIVCHLLDQDRTIGYLVIDSTIDGRSMGGLRMLPDVNVDELRHAARSMTLKYGFLGLPQGGAKAGLCCEPEALPDDRRSALAAFARLAEPFLRRGIYTPNSDMGTNADDIAYLLGCLGIRQSRQNARQTDSGYYTAQSAFACAQRAARYLGFEIAGATMAVEGLGRVGGTLAQLLHQAGARIVAASTAKGALYAPQGLDVPALLGLLSEHGSAGILKYTEAERLALQDLLELPVDVLCPCARLHSIHGGNAHRVRARLICPGANNPISLEAERVISQRGLVSLPDFVTNAGGVLGGTMEFAACRRPEIVAFIHREIGSRLGDILQEAQQSGSTPRQVAESLALARRRQIVLGQQQRSLAHAALSLGLRAYRRGWAPAWPVARIAPTYLAKTMAARSRLP